MNDPTTPAAQVWHPLEYDQAWAPFSNRFNFTPGTLDTPAITLPANSLVVDLSPVFSQSHARFAAAEAAINASALHAFVWLADEGDLLALDWQHPAYRYSPAAQALVGDHSGVPVFPNGDYYVHAQMDLAWGTFGHPWQQTLTIWGDVLIDQLGAELCTWLPQHPSSPRHEAD